MGELVVGAPNVKLGSGRGPGIWGTYRREDVNNEVSGSEARTAYSGRGEGDDEPSVRLHMRVRGSMEARRMSR